MKWKSCKMNSIQFLKKITCISSLIFYVKIGYCITWKVIERHFWKKNFWDFCFKYNNNGEKLQFIKFHEKIMCEIFLIFCMKWQQHEDLKLMKMIFLGRVVEILLSEFKPKEPITMFFWVELIFYYFLLEVTVALKLQI